MGAGQSDGIKTALAAASEAEVRQVLAGLDGDSRAKLVAALEKTKTAYTGCSLHGAEDDKAFEAAYGLEAGGCNVKHEAWINVGCGNLEYYCAEKGATFDPRHNGDLPDLSEHNSFLVDFLKTEQGKKCWQEMKDKKTELGVTLAKCVKTGIDNKGHPNIKTVGLVGGDEECFKGVFKDLFIPITRSRHGFMEGKHVSDMNVEGLSKTDMDPFNNYVRTARVRTGRSVSGFRLPPCNSFAERRTLEKTITDALMQLGGELKGKYYPLPGSKSNPQGDLPEGMSQEKGKDLLAKGNLFQEPDSTLLLSGGMGRHWPDARGIYHNDDQTLFVWLNEEDHMRIVSMQGDKKTCTPQGKDMRAVAKRFMDACNNIEKLGLSFMKSDDIGWILTCPSNCGTGLRAGCQVYVGRFYSHLTNGGKPVTDGKAVDQKPWKKAMASMGLQARGTGGVDDTATEIFDVSNADRMGKTDVTLVNICIEGIAFLVLCEHALTKDYEGNKAHVDAALAVAQSPIAGATADAQLNAGAAKLKELIPNLMEM